MKLGSQRDIFTSVFIAVLCTIAKIWKQPVTGWMDKGGRITCVYVCACVYVYVYVYIHIYTSVCVCLHICLYAYNGILFSHEKEANLVLWRTFC